MGFNTTVVILNDALDMIRNDPEFARRLADAIGAAWDGVPVHLVARSATGRGSSSAGSVIETHHADYDVLVRVGGNRGEVVREPTP